MVGTVHNMNAGLASDLSLKAAAADNAFLAISTERRSGIGKKIELISGHASRTFGFILLDAVEDVFERVVVLAACIGAVFFSDCVEERGQNRRLRIASSASSLLLVVKYEVVVVVVIVIGVVQAVLVL